MSNYLFIQSQDPFTETRTRHQYDLALQLFEAGHQVIGFSRRIPQAVLFDWACGNIPGLDEILAGC